MRRIRLPLAAAMLAAASGAWAQQAPAPAPAQQEPTVPTRITAATLLNVCNAQQDPCLTYVLGTADAFAFALAASGRPQRFCVPPAVTNAQMTQAAVDFIRAHPEEANSNAAVVVFSALMAAYPCA